MSEPVGHEAAILQRRGLSITDRLLLVGTIGVAAAALVSLGDAPQAKTLPRPPTAIEGFVTAGCLEGDHNLTLEPGHGFYLGDRTLDNGNTTDAFWVKNTQGAIIHSQTHDDDGSIGQVNGGFSYTENGDKYSVLFTNWDNTLGGIIAVRVVVECAELPAIDPGIVVVS